MRFGGYRGPRGYVFELSGGALCLDLANTLDERGADEPRELLGDYEDLVSWGVQSGAIPRRANALLRREATRDPAAARAALDRARALRENLFSVFSRVADGGLPGRAPLERLGAGISDALARRRLAAKGGEIAWSFPEGGSVSLDRILRPVLISAAELLVSAADRGRVRRCEGDRCAWLFVDRSKNRSRRWCDMTVCGNRVKARRHYARATSSLRLPPASRPTRSPRPS